MPTDDCGVTQTRAALAAQLTELAGHLNAGEYRFLTLLAEFDRQKGWMEAGCYTCVHWLCFACGIGVIAGREKVRVAHALCRLPKISEAMRLGQLSYSKVRALVRVATPETEDTLLMIAQHGTAHHVEAAVRGFRRAQEAEELDREQRQHLRKSVTYSHDDDGSLVLRAHLPAEVGALVVKAIEAGFEDIPRAHLPAGAPDTRRAAKRADALAIVAESFLANGGRALKGGDRTQIVIHVDAETLRNRTAGRCELEHGPSLAAETARRLACDCSAVLLVEDERGNPLDIGRRTRTIPPAMYRALKARDKHCRFPGCTHSRYIQGHHLRHWADGGATKLANLILTCSWHHREIHEGRIQVRVLDDGAIQFLRPDGTPFQTSVALTGDLEQLQTQNDHAGIHIDRNTAMTKWRGERMDLGMAVGALMSQRRPGQVSDRGSTT